MQETHHFDKTLKSHRETSHGVDQIKKKKNYIFKISNHFGLQVFFQVLVIQIKRCIQHNKMSDIVFRIDTGQHLTKYVTYDLQKLSDIPRPCFGYQLSAQTVVGMLTAVFHVKIKHFGCLIHCNGAVPNC